MLSTRSRRWLAAGLLVAAPAAVPAAHAADNVPGKWYENELVGFKFRPLNEWQAIPQGTDPSDPNIGGFYSDAAKFDGRTRPELTMFAFKQARNSGVATPSTGDGTPEGPPPDDGKKGPTTEEEAIAEAMARMRVKSTRQALDQMRTRISQIADQMLAGLDEKKRKKLLKELDLKEPVETKKEVDDLTITTCEANIALPLMNGEVIPGKLFAAWATNEEYEVGLLYEIPGDQWKKYGKGVMSSVYSLQFLEGAEVAAARSDLADALAGKTGDERWLEEIKRKVTPGWSHKQTKNYLVIYDKAVKPDRIRLIAVQIEAIRKDIYEVAFPSDRPVTAISVVRVCKDKDQYHQYGGPGGSAGYWNSGEQELVFYEDTAAKKDSLRVLNHEAFHQYIFYSVGSISPHDWFNEGHGDFFSGHDIVGGRFVPKPFRWRTDTIRSAIGSKAYIPLKRFMSYNHSEYYGPQIGQNYAQGWSVIWFLRLQKNPEWKGILDAYFTTLKGEVTKWVQDQEVLAKKEGRWKEGWKPGHTPNEVEEGARQKAYDAAFGGWDDRKWDRFEREWKEFL